MTDEQDAGVPQVLVRVLLKLLAFDGKHKIADKYEEYLYIAADETRRTRYSSSRAEDEEKPKNSNRLKTLTTLTSSSESDAKELVGEERVSARACCECIVDKVNQPASSVSVCYVRQVIPDDMLQPVALPPPIGWDQQPDLYALEVDQQADLSDTELKDTDDLTVVPPPPPLPDDTFP